MHSVRTHPTRNNMQKLPSLFSSESSPPWLLTHLRFLSPGSSCTHHTHEHEHEHQHRRFTAILSTTPVTRLPFLYVTKQAPPRGLRHK